MTATEAEQQRTALIHTLDRLRSGLLAMDADDQAPRDSDPAPVPEEPPPGQRPAVAVPLPRRGAAPVPQQAAAAADLAIAAIRETFRYVAEAGDKAAGFFYGQLFLRQPHLRQLFPPAMDEQRDRLLRALGWIMETQSTQDGMADRLAQLGRDHCKYGVQPEMYEAVSAALLATLRTFAGDAFTRQAEDAWTQVCSAGTSMMIRAAEQDAGQSPPWWTAEVVSVDHRADHLAVLTIAPDQPLPFTAGQHLTVQSPRWPGVWRPYSIAGMPRDDGLLTLHVKVVPGAG